MARTHNIEKPFALTPLQLIDPKLDITRGELAIMLVLLRYATMKHSLGNPQFMEVWLSSKNISKQSFTSRTTVFDALKKFQRLGLVHITPRPGTSDIISLAKLQQTLDRLVGKLELTPEEQSK